MSNPSFFGYGSLVNVATHVYRGAQPARLQGWRREWRVTQLRDAAFLSVQPDPQAHIDGLIAEVPGGNWAALDERETGYFRRDITQAITHPTPVAIYQICPDVHAATGTAGPIWLSYLDVVVQGYLEVFGPQGVTDFFDSTSGWEVGVLDDRAAPLYPRAQTLTAEETALVDHHLAAVVK